MPDDQRGGSAALYPEQRRHAWRSLPGRASGPWLFGLFALLAAHFAWAGVLAVDGAAHWPMSLARQVTVYEDAAGTATWETVAAMATDPQGGFRPGIARTRPGHTKSAWWTHFAVVNQGARPLTLIFTQETTNLDTLDYHVERNGAWSHLAMGLKAPERMRYPGLARLQAVPLDLQPGEQVRVLVKAQGDSIFLLQPRLYTRGTFLGSENRLTLWNAAFFGSLLAVAWCGLLIALFTRNGSFGLLALLCLAVFVYEASLRGYAGLYFWPSAIEWNLRSARVAGCLALSIFLFMVLHVARREHIAWPAERYYYGLAALEALLAAAGLVGDPYVIGRMGVLLAMVYGLSLPVAAVLLARRAASAGRFTLPGRLTILTGALLLAHIALRTLEQIGAMPEGFAMRGLQDTAGHPAFGLLGLLLNLSALIGWIALIRKQRKDARAALDFWQDKEQDRLKESVARQTAAVARALHYAGEKSRRHSETLDYLGHELRAPLAAIAEPPDAPREGEPCDAAGRPHAAQRLAGHQLAMLDELIDYAGGGGRQADIRPKVVELRGLLADLADYAGTLCARSGNRFEHAISAALPARVVTDGRRLQQILANLVANSVRFTRGGTLRLEADAIRIAGAWRLGFTVSDTGSRLEAADGRPVLQAGSPLQAGRGGVGLGLFIAQRLVDNMGARLELAAAPDGGNRFRFQVVAQDADLAAGRAAGEAGAQDRAGPSPTLAPTVP